MTFQRNYFSTFHLAKNTSKKELSLILEESPIDLESLTKFALKNTLSCDYRSIVWKLLLSISPRFADSQEFVHEQHVLIYQDVFRALKALQLAYPIIRKDCKQNGNFQLGSETTLKLSSWDRCKCFVDPKTPEPEHIFFMWLISQGRLQRDPEAQLNLPANQRYIHTGHKIHSLLDDPVDVFHFSCALWSSLRINESKIRGCVGMAYDSLRKRNGELHRHLSCVGLFSDPILEELSLSLFIEILPDSPIEKIIDKIFAGGFVIISYFIVELLCQLKNILLSSNSVEAVRNIFFQIRKEKADTILNASLEEFHRSQL